MNLEICVQQLNTIGFVSYYQGYYNSNMDYIVVNLYLMHMDIQNLLQFQNKMFLLLLSLSFLPKQKIYIILFYQLKLNLSSNHHPHFRHQMLLFPKPQNYYPMGPCQLLFDFHLCFHFDHILTYYLHLLSKYQGPQLNNLVF